MTLTRQKKKAAIKHLLETVFDLDSNSPIQLALEQNGLSSPHDIVSLNDVEFELLMYKPAGATEAIPLQKGHASCLKAFKALVVHKAATGNPIDDDWISITQDDFDKFRISPEYVLGGTARASLLSISYDPVREFRRGVKHDVTQFVPLHDEGAGDNWQYSTIAQA